MTARSQGGNPLLESRSGVNLPVAAVRLTALVLVLGLVWPGALRAGTTGRISGRVLDQSGRPVVAATLSLVDTRLGAYTDEEGRYNILNVPPGTYALKVSRLGFEPVRVEQIQVSADQTTRMNIEMKETTITSEEVVVTAEKPPVDLNLTSTKATVTSEQIEDLPVQDLQDVVNLQAGVVDGHVRGGREDEVQYQVDGVSVNNAYDNSSMFKVDRTLLQEVQVISGTFDAEYGQAMSGVVNAVLKDGTEDFEAQAEIYTGDFVFSESSRGTRDVSDPFSTQSYQATLSGPLLSNTVFLVSGRRYIFNDWIQGKRLFLPTSRWDFGTHELLAPSGTDSADVTLGYSREWSGVAKVTNRSLGDLELSYQALANYIKGRNTDFAFRFIPDAMPKHKTFSISHGLDATYTLGASSFIDFSFRHNYFHYEDYAAESFYDSLYDYAGPTRTDPNFYYGGINERGAIVQGVSFTRFEQTTSTPLVKASLTTQVTPVHLVKVGAEMHLPKVQFGTPGHLVYAVQGAQEHLLRYADQPPDFPGLRTYWPRTASAYAQDHVELPDLTLRFGLRFDYLDAHATVPSDPANPANAIPDQPPSHAQKTSVKTAVSPRIGVAYPIEDKAAIHFAYGHFYQFPSVSEMFSNADYDILQNLQAGIVNYNVLGNPDVKPEQTVQYEIGYKHEITPDLGIDLTAFYKDIRDLLGVEFINTYNDAEYARLTNVDFGNVFGVTLSLDHRRLGPISLSLDYTWQQAEGNSSDPRETAIRAEAGDDPRPRLVYFNWDQRHTFNMTVALNEPGNYSASAVLRVASGQPYTPILEAGFGQGLQENSGRKPSGAVLDLRAEKNLDGLLPAGWTDRGSTLHLFGRVFNVLDTRYFNGMVFASTGSVDYSRFTEADYVTLQDPSRFYQPRRIELGLRLGWGGGQ